MKVTLTLALLFGLAGVFGYAGIAAIHELKQQEKLNERLTSECLADLIKEYECAARLRHRFMPSQP